MARVALSSLPSGTPVEADSLIFTDANDGGAAKIANPFAILGLMFGNFAEIRAVSGALIGPASYTTSDTACVFSRNVPTSAEVAGGPNAGTVLTADQANNKIIVPPNTKIYVEFWVAMALANSTSSDNTTWEARAVLDGTADDDTLGSFGSAVNAAGANTGIVVTGGGIIEHSGGSAADLTLGIRNTVGAFSAYQSAAMLRAIKIGAA